MNKTRICYMLIMISLFFLLSIYSQTTESYRLLRNDFYNSFPLNYKNNSDKLLDHERHEYNNLIEIYKQLNPFITVIDSVIVTREDFSKRKCTINYDSDGKMTLWLSEDWDENHWVYAWRDSYTYDSNGIMTSRQWEYWDGSKWVNDWRDSYTYDSNGNKTSFLSEEWNGSQWMNTGRHCYTYDSKWNLTLDLYEDWDGSKWVSSGRDTYGYDSIGTKTSKSSEYWDGSQWVIFQKDNYSYDADGNMTLILFEHWEGSNWVIFWRHINIYDSIGNLTSFLSEAWDGSQWVSRWRQTYKYDSNNTKTLELFEMWDESQWVNLQRVNYSYDSNGNMTSELMEEWDGSQWVNFRRDSYAYDSDGRLTVFLNEVWEDSGWALSDYGGFGGFDFIDSYGNIYQFYCAKLEIYYKTLSDINEESSLKAYYILTQNYPNPFNPSTTIKYSIPINVYPAESGEKRETFTPQNAGRDVKLMVYDVLGREVATLVNKEQPQGNYEVEFDGSELTSGIYFYRLKAGDYVETKKMILLK